MIVCTVRKMSTWLHPVEKRSFADVDAMVRWAAACKEGGTSVNLLHDQDGYLAIIEDGLPKNLRRKPF